MKKIINFLKMFFHYNIKHNFIDWRYHCIDCNKCVTPKDFKKGAGGWRCAKHNKLKTV